MNRLPRNDFLICGQPVEVLYKNEPPAACAIGDRDSHMDYL